MWGHKKFTSPRWTKSVLVVGDPMVNGMDESKLLRYVINYMLLILII